MSPEVSPDPVLESLDQQELASVVQNCADDLEMQAASLEVVARNVQAAIDQGKTPDLKRAIYECRQTQNLAAEVRPRLRRAAGLFDQSGVIYLSPQGARRGLFFFTMLLACVIVGMGIVLSH